MHSFSTSSSDRYLLSVLSGKEGSEEGRYTWRRCTHARKLMNHSTATVVTVFGSGLVCPLKFEVSRFIRLDSQFTNYMEELINFL